MEKRLNIAEVAELAGVSTATVSRVLNDYPFVKESTKNRVLKVIRETNYRLNAVARNLRRKKTHSIGVIISNVLSPFYSVIAKAVEDVAIENNYSTILCNGGDNSEKERKYLKVLHENRVDGIIISPTGKNADYFNFLLSSAIPISFIDRTVQGVNCDCVMVNNRKASFKATELMIKKGYRRISFISGPLDIITGSERFKGYVSALKKHGINVDESLIKYGDFSLESGKEKMEELIRSTDLDAVYVANSDMATGAYILIKEKKLKIPENIGFLMFDDPVWTILATPKVTAVSQPVYTLGSTGAELLFKRINDPKNINQKSVKVTLETRLIERESV